MEDSKLRNGNASTGTMTESTAQETSLTVPKKDESLTHPKTTILSAQAWDIWSPPPVDSLKGHFVPSSLVKFSRRRRITVEVHRITVPAGGKKKGDKSSSHVKGENRYYDECVVRILVPANAEEDKKSRKRGKEALKHLKDLRKTAAHLGSTVRSGARSVADSHVEYNADGSDDASALGIGLEIDDGESIHGEDGEPAWKPKHKLPVDDVTIHKVIMNRCMVTTNHMGVRHARSLIFDADDQAHAFASLIEIQKSYGKTRADQKLNALLGGIKVKSEEHLSLLVEIVSAGNLPIADLSSSDPFVVASLNGKEIHRTKHVSKSLDPIWTVKNGSLFMLEVTARELFSSPQGMMFHLFDFDQFGGNESLGVVYVPAKTLYESKGERMEFQLEKAPRQHHNYDYSETFLAIRCRHATEYDKKFMKELNSGGRDKKSEDPNSAEAKATAVSGGKSGVESMITRYRKLEKHGSDAGVYKYKVRPGPDPKRKEETEWLSTKKIDEECMMESRHWLDLGSGPVGRLFVEILKCDGLPQLDTGVAGNKTDTFVSVIFEDGIMKTDIIDDCLSPRWLPWTKRAFIFHMLHSSSPLYLGLFDYDAGLGALDDHDLIGKVSIDVSNLRPETVYIMTYDIFNTATMSTRHSKGTVTVRIRLEIDDERSLLLSNLEPPPQIYVHVSSKKDYHVAKQTLTGKDDPNNFSMKLIYAYIEELTAYKYSTLYLQDAIIALLLWRGSSSFSVFGKEFKLPIHSMNAFLVGVLLVERPELMPSFFFASIAWLFLAVMGFRRRSPNPWAKCKTFYEMLEILLFGKSGHPPDSIEPYENEEEAKLWLEAMQDRVKHAEEEAQKAAEEAAKAEEERQKELEEIGEVDMAISKGGISINPYRVILWPVQRYLSMAVRAVRLGKNIVLWEECYFAFWITFGCLVLATVFLFVPWFWIMKWSSRITVWTLFGPWMKLVDVFYYSKLKPLSDEEKEEKLLAERLRQREATAAEVKEARIAKENTLKMKEIKKYMFGKYITQVPVLKQERYKDNPLPESYCTPYAPEPLGLADLAMKEAGYNRTRLPGQYLVGDMIPRVETKSFTDAPVGKPAARPHRLDKNSPGRVSGTDSTAAAYAKIGTLVVAAAAITWYGIPTITSIAESLLGMQK